MRINDQLNDNNTVQRIIQHTYRQLKKNGMNKLIVHIADDGNNKKVNYVLYFYYYTTSTNYNRKYLKKFKRLFFRRTVNTLSVNSEHCARAPHDPVHYETWKWNKWNNTGHHSFILLYNIDSDTFQEVLITDGRGSCHNN